MKRAFSTNGTAEYFIAVLRISGHAHPSLASLEVALLSIRLPSDYASRCGSCATKRQWFRILSSFLALLQASDSAGCLGEVALQSPYIDRCVLTRRDFDIMVILTAVISAVRRLRSRSKNELSSSACAILTRHFHEYRNMHMILQVRTRRRVCTLLLERDGQRQGDQFLRGVRSV